MNGIMLRAEVLRAAGDQLPEALQSAFRERARIVHARRDCPEGTGLAASFSKGYSLSRLRAARNR
jgi:hypothetical protein